MHPILFEIGPFPLHTYGFLIVIGFFCGVFLLRRKARLQGLNEDLITDIAFWGLILGLLGGRLLFVITRWQDYVQDPLRIFKIWEGGLVYYGGFLTGFAVFLFLSRKHKLNKLDITDMAAPSLAIAHFFGRLGCFAAGCCYGSQCPEDHPFAVIFRDPRSIAPIGVPLHPAQLYDAVNALIIFLVLHFLYFRRQFTGQITAIYFMVYAIGRTIVEVYRGDSIRGFVIEGVLSTSQFISIFTFLAGVALYIYGWRRHRSS